MTAHTPHQPLDGYGTITIRTSGDSTTCTHGSFVKVDKTHHGVTDVAADSDEVFGIWRSATSTTEDEAGVVSTSGVWKVTQASGVTLEPGDTAYPTTSTTIGAGTTSDHPCGIIVDTVTNTAGQVYMLLVPPGIYFTIVTVKA